jgi:hypothetical protein
MKNGLATAHVGRLGATLLGVYLIAIGVVPYVLPSAVVLVSALAVVTGVVILVGR